MASNDLIWLLTRNNSSFLVKRNGIQLSREVGNLSNRNSYKDTGLTGKAVGISPNPAGTGVVVSLKTSKGKRAVVLKGNVRQSASAVKSLVSKYRPDLVKSALARVSAIVASQGPAKVVKPRKVRGNKK